MIPEDYDSLTVRNLKSVINSCEDSDLVIFKSRNGFIFEGYGITGGGLNEGLTLFFESTPVFCEDKEGVKDFKPYCCELSLELFEEYPFFEWMVFEAFNRLSNKNDFIEFYNVDGVLLGRLSVFDCFFVKDNDLFIMKDNDVHAHFGGCVCSYSVDLSVVCYMKFCLC